MNLEPDFRDFVQLLNQYEVEYMVVGGYALALHGEPRFTGDLDVWIDCTKANADKMLSVMKDSEPHRSASPGVIFWTGALLNRSDSRLSGSISSERLTVSYMPTP